jgi:tetratricopeptide (TPR) repeat protein
MVADQLKDLPGLWNRLTAAYLLVGDSESFDQLVERRPRSITGIGDLYAATEQWEQAIAFFDQQLADDADNAALLVKRGEAHAELEHWDQAQADWRRAAQSSEGLLLESMHRFRLAEKWMQAAKVGMVYINQDRSDRIRWLRVVPSLVLAKDQTGYREFCQSMVKQFADTTDEATAESTCKACLLLPDAVDLSTLPLKAFADSLDDGTMQERLRPWAWAARALVAYRSGDSELASEYVQQVWAIGPGDLPRALTFAIAALERRGRGDHEGAREALGHVRRMVDQRLPNTKAAGMHDWLIPKILADEAEVLLNDEGESSEAERNTGSD